MLSHHFAAKMAWCRRQHSPKDQRNSLYLLLVAFESSQVAKIGRRQILQQSHQVGKTGGVWTYWHSLIL